MRSYYVDARWTLVASRFEALINTDRDDPKWQFRFRVAQLASELQINLTDDELDRAYDMRSKLVHAESFLVGLGSILPRIEHNALYGKLESLLRMVLQRCLLDDAFGAHFEDAAAVKTRWPLPPKPKRKPSVP
jgi:hypothetical protein